MFWCVAIHTVHLCIHNKYASSFQVPELNGAKRGEQLCLHPKASRQMVLAKELAILDHLPQLVIAPWRPIKQVSDCTSNLFAIDA